MSRKTLVRYLLVAVALAGMAAPTVAEVRGRPRPSLEAPAAKSPARPPLIEPVEISAAKAPAGPRSVALLRTWDSRRAEAWSRGDPTLLRQLYTPSSVAGRHDRAMLRAWTDRGLVVQELRTQLLSVRVLAHDPTTWTLLVTDRLADGVAVGPGVRRELPLDLATTRVVRFRRVAGEWRVASVLPTRMRRTS